VTMLQCRVPTIVKVLEQSVMVFSKNYLPLSRVNIKRAIILGYGKAQALIWPVRSNRRFTLPSDSLGANTLLNAHHR